MNEILYNLWHDAKILVGICLILYYTPYLIKRGWDSGENDVNPKKKKVCDACFRDIDKVSKMIKEGKLG